MSQNDLWKYCTAEQVKEAIVSLHLLEGLPVEEKDYGKWLYSVSRHVEKHYHKTVIPKRNGGKRMLLVPDRLLAAIQKNILKHVLWELPVSEYAFAYRKGGSVLNNALPHVGAEKILKLDISDFFGSISFLQVYQKAFPSIYFPPAIRTLLANLCCYKDCLPQGAPTSPAVSNLVMQPFDAYMGAWCGERGIQYTRYCDDMTFSGAFEEKEVIRKVRGFLSVLGMELNESKTQVLSVGKRQLVTGIVVNEKPQTAKAYRRTLRAEIYYCEKYGVENHLRHCGRDAKEAERYLQSLLGKVNYVIMINPEDIQFQQAREKVKEMMCRLVSKKENVQEQA